ncbi:cytochrome P450 [Aspergillus pseudoustus]|uniref:Cytochrome P450 n=1 Tax=Aspergillus pseudoustus TaxID=1810923 RepID=A0ABR4K5G4_9EURO
MLQLESSGLLGIGLICLVPAALLYIINALFLRVTNPQGVPLIREPTGKKSFSLKTRLAYMFDCEALFREAYQNYSKVGKPVIIPGFGVRDEIILPSSSMRWALAQPDSALSVAQAFVEVDQVVYSLGHTRYVADPWQGLLVRREMNSVLEIIVAAMNDELGIAFDARFGTDEENWKEIDLLETVRMVVAQAASRFTVGLPLCRNEQYLKDSFDVVDGCIINAGVTGGTPKILRPIIGRLVSLKSRLAQKKVMKHFEPTYRARLETLKHAKDDPSEPQDHLQMMIRYAERERRHELYDLDIMARRLSAANFGSMHQTSIQVTNMLLNIMGSDAEYNTIAVLRDEVNRILGDEKTWTKAKVSKMTRADSVARETLRCQSFGGRAVFRKVMKDGVVTDTGVELPKGCLISFFSQPVHADEAKYEDPLKYDPFRFSRIREADAAKANTLSFVSTSPDNLPFGHGKHACPGRFLVDFELKMIIAYVLTHYDVKFPAEYHDKRPENKWLTEAIVPPPGAKILIKRRKNAQ